MPVEYLSAEQEARYGRFATEPSPGELEQFFRLDSRALESARAKRRPATRLGWAVQWGTVRMLGTFLTEDPTAVPASAVRFVAEQLALDDDHFAGYGARAQTAYEHAWEIRDAYCYRDFGARRSCGSSWRRGCGRRLKAARIVRPAGGVAGEQPDAAARGHEDDGGERD